MKGKYVVRISLKHILNAQESSGLEPPTKALTTSQSIPPKPDTKVQPIKEEKHKNKFKAAGKTFKVGDYAYVTGRKYIGRIDAISFPSEDTKAIIIDVTW